MKIIYESKISPLYRKNGRITITISPTALKYEAHLISLGALGNWNNLILGFIVYR